MLLTKPAFYSPGVPPHLSMSQDVLLSAQAPEISAADRPDNIMRYDRSAESDSEIAVEQLFRHLCINIFFNSQELLIPNH